MKLKYCSILFLIILCLNITNAQITFSPYTIFAAGQIEPGGSGSNHALGGTGIAFKSNLSLNNINPASYGGIDSLSFLFDIGVFGKYSVFKSKTTEQSKFESNISYIAMGFRINKWWSASLGVSPYSSVGYNIKTKKEMEGEPSYYFKTFTGSGGINQFYLGNAFKLFKNFSFGLNLSYLMGTIEQNESVKNGEDLLYTITKSTHVHNLYADYGLQYTFSKKDWKYTAGIIYGNKKTLNTISGIQVIYSGDTADLGNIDQQYLIPRKYGIGFAIEKNNQIKTGIDYERRDWSDLEFKNPLLETRNSDRLSFGFEYTPYKTYHDGGLKRWYYRIGANYNRSYLIIDKKPIDSKEITFGVGIPLRKQLNMLNISFEIGENGTKENQLIKENYYQIHINFSMHDLWFQKPKYD
jgi:hypothetical protein